MTLYRYISSCTIKTNITNQKQTNELSNRIMVTHPTVVIVTNAHHIPSENPDKKVLGK